MPSNWFPRNCCHCAHGLGGAVGDHAQLQTHNLLTTRLHDGRCRSKETLVNAFSSENWAETAWKVWETCHKTAPRRILLKVKWLYHSPWRRGRTRRARFGDILITVRTPHVRSLSLLLHAPRRTETSLLRFIANSANAHPLSLEKACRGDALA